MGDRFSRLGCHSHSSTVVVLCYCTTFIVQRPPVGEPDERPSNPGGHQFGKATAAPQTREARADRRLHPRALGKARRSEKGASAARERGAAGRLAPPRDIIGAVLCVVGPTAMTNMTGGVVGG